MQRSPQIQWNCERESRANQVYRENREHISLWRERLVCCMFKNYRYMRRSPFIFFGRCAVSFSSFNPCKVFEKQRRNFIEQRLSVLTYLSVSFCNIMETCTFPQDQIKFSYGLRKAHLWKSFHKTIQTGSQLFVGIRSGWTKVRH